MGPEQITRRHLLGTVLAGMAAPAAAAPRPNILFLMTDEHRADCVGYRNPQIHTPHLDRLAKESVVFTNAYSTSPSCVPARAAIYTGRYPTQCGAPTYITYLPDSEVTFMSRLQKAGYYTAAIGKQHFGESTIQRGYDYQDIVDNAGEKNSSYQQFLKQNGILPKDVRKPSSRFASYWTAPQKFHIDDFMGEQARTWVKDKLPTDRPWFLTVSFHGPHQPFDGLGLPYQKLYAGEKIELPHTQVDQLKDKPPHYQDELKQSPGLTDAEIRDMRLSYYSKISMIDEKIGEILDALRASGQYDNTLIVHTADHGDFMGEFGLVYKAQYLSEALMRIPMLAKPPIANYPGRVETAFVQNFDIAPTCMALAGIADTKQMSAEDLSKFWREPEKAQRRKYCYLDGHTLQGLRDERWKLVHYRDRPYGEMYDLQNDPWEKKNLWGTAAVAAKQAELQDRLLNHVMANTSRAGADWNVGAPKI